MVIGVVIGRAAPLRVGNNAIIIRVPYMSVYSSSKVEHKITIVHYIMSTHNLQVDVNS